MFFEIININSLIPAFKHSSRIYSKLGLPLIGKSSFGKIIQINNDGSSSIFSKGHRNPQGLFIYNNEFILSSELGIHPLAFVHHEELKNYVETGELASGLKPYHESFLSTDMNDVRSLVESMESRAWAYNDKRDLFIDKLREGVGLICAAFYPRPVLVRLSDFKSNEYRNLLGGELYEPNEENPMIGWRGASRYYSESFKEAFNLECEAIKYCINNMLMTNIIVMIPFVRTPSGIQGGSTPCFLFTGFPSLGIGPKLGFVP